MEKDEKSWEDCLNRILQLPTKSQEAIFWLIDNYELVVKMCKVRKLTQAERDYFRKKAAENDDAFLKLLVEFENLINSPKC